MILLFLKQQWKEFWRSRNQAGSIAGKIVMGILIVYLLLNALLIGIFSKEVLQEFLPGRDPFAIFRQFLLYYFLMDFIVRLQFQEMPALSIQPYLTLNIARKRIVNFLNTKTLFSFFNFIPIFLLLPFCFRVIEPQYGIWICIAFVLSILSLTVMNNFLAMYIKRQGSINPWITLIGFIVVLALIGLDYFKIISVRSFSDWIFAELTSAPYLFIIFTALAWAAIKNNSTFLNKNMYIEELAPEKNKKVITDFPFLNRFGKVGELVALEIKLIIRHKRSRMTIIMAGVFLFYGLIFFNPEYQRVGPYHMLVFASLFMTGLFEYMYGQYMFAWHSTHFDGLMANRISYRDFIKANFLLFSIVNGVIILLLMLYGLMDWKLIPLLLACYLYNEGLGSVIILFLACLNKKRLDLAKGAAFNWQGVSYTQWLLILIVMALPMILFSVFNMGGNHFRGILAIGILGIISIAMRGFWIKWITNFFISQRHKIAEGFRA